MKKEEYQKALNGCEINSLRYEGVVYVTDGKAFRDGEEIKVSWKTLWKEYTEGEGIAEELRWLRSTVFN